MSRTLTVCLATLVLAASPRAQPPSAGPDPLAVLPSWMRVVLSWGQRPEWESDSRHLIVMEKAFGGAYRLDIATGKVEPMTTRFFHEGFDRAHQLANGDYLLTATPEFDARDPWKTRHRRGGRGLTPPVLGRWVGPGSRLRCRE